MSRILYEIHCNCNQEISVTRKRSYIAKSEGKPILYPDTGELTSMMFEIKYEYHLSSLAKFLLNSFQHKYLYYVMDDIIYLLQNNRREQDNLLELLYSTVLFLQNNFSINFFDIWIQEIHINEINKTNKFLNINSQKLDYHYTITLKLLYRTKVPIQKRKSLW